MGIRGREDTSNRIAVLGKGLDKRMQHLNFNALYAYTIPSVQCIDNAGMCTSPVRVFREKQPICQILLEKSEVCGI